MPVNYKAALRIANDAVCFSMGQFQGIIVFCAI
jgi:hypothetical protein